MQSQVAIRNASADGATLSKRKRVLKRGLFIEVTSERLARCITLALSPLVLLRHLHKAHICFIANGWRHVIRVVSSRTLLQAALLIRTQRPAVQSETRRARALAQPMAKDVQSATRVASSQ